MRSLLLYGGGGHGKVVLDILAEAGRYEVLGVLDDDGAKRGRDFQGYPILGGAEVLENPAYRNASLLLAIGDNRQRQEVADRVGKGREFASAFHPASHLARSVRVGGGTVVMAGVVINTDTVLGDHVIVNTASSIDHDCVIHSFVHISPGAHLAGGVSVGERAHIGIGASVIPGVQIGRDAIVGAGAVVIDDVAEGETVMGVPARPKVRRGRR